ncbi:hypothetical protein FIBSPDRAFT_948836 [Athelia psychrophila]|uniref:Uncharacterized protein n=1 Tax=Athelia psychrophila TaxID=1759441 RepID=A0A166QJ79_9AGAM|nr:hypothetical protein FIBSPDRAFT_948836 [Fibularhizoctonia sp. CBS 109695]
MTTTHSLIQLVGVGVGARHGISLIRTTVSDDADVIVFLEYSWNICLQGIVDWKEILHPAQRAIDFLCASAKKHSISIVGAIVEPQIKSASTTTSSVLPEPTTSPVRVSYLRPKTTPRPDSATQES